MTGESMSGQVKQIRNMFFSNPAGDVISAGYLY